MPVLKPIAGHTNCQGIKRYLEKNGRALARDFFNLSWDEREMEGYDESGKAEVRWADEMDTFRDKHHNSEPYRGMPARTYKHYVISPDPDDNIDLPALRELACAWALKYFGDYQIAIVYHDDNEHRIPHAHVVVNNTNVITKRRMQTEFPMDLNRDLQEMARERGLSGLSNVVVRDEGLAELASKDEPKKPGPRTRQQVYYGRKEKEIAAAGNYSWVADLRNRVSVAKTLARNEAEFRQILERLEVNITDNSPKAKRTDWVYSLAEEPTKKVSGERLGLLYGKETLQRDFERKGSYHPTAKSSQEVLRIARNAVVVNDLADLDRISGALSVCAWNGVSSIEECTRRAESLRKRAEKAEPDKRQGLLDAASELEQARDFMRSRNLMPQRIERKQPEKSKHPRTSSSRRDANRNEVNKQVQHRQQEQQRAANRRKDR